MLRELQETTDRLMELQDAAGGLKELQESADRARQLQWKADIRAAAAEHKSAGAKRMVSVVWLQICACLVYHCLSCNLVILIKVWFGYVCLKCCL